MLCALVAGLASCTPIILGKEPHGKQWQRLRASCWINCVLTQHWHVETSMHSDSWGCCACPCACSAAVLQWVAGYGWQHTATC